MPLIAMTREMGSLGKDVAEQVAARRGRKVVYHEMVDPIASKTRLRKSHVERFLDGRSGIWERLATDRTSLASFTPEETFGILRDDSTAVVRGWGAAQLLRTIPHVIRVRICAPLELRVERMMRRLATDNREAVEGEIRLSEEAHTAIAKRHFCVNWKDPENYDVVLCTERLSVEECVAELERLLQMRAFQATADSERLVDDLALEWRVRAALRRDARTAATVVTVRSALGTVQLDGIVELQGEASAAAEVAAAVEGARRVDSRLVPAASAPLHQRREA